MRKYFAILLSIAVLFGILAGCTDTGSDLTLSDEMALQFKQSYLAYEKLADVCTAEQLTLRVVWNAGDLYAVYVDGGQEYSAGVEQIQLVEFDEEGAPLNYYTFWFLTSQMPYICQGSEIYSLKEAYDAGVLTVEHVKSLLKDDVYRNYETPEDLRLSEELKKKIKTAYIEFMDLPESYTADDITLHAVWHDGDTYAVYVYPANGSGIVDMPYQVMLDKPDNGANFEGYYCFEFPGKALFIYSEELYDLEVAYKQGVLSAAQVEALLKDDTYKNDPCYSLP